MEISLQGNSSIAVDLEPIWGSTGAFAFSLWIQQRPDPGTLFQYLVSARSNATGFEIEQLTDVYQPNEVKSDVLMYISMQRCLWKQLK